MIEFLLHFFAFFVSTWNFQCSENKNEPHKSSISEVIDSERCAYSNALEGLFPKIFSQWISYQIAKTAEICRKVLLSYFFDVQGQIELEKVIFKVIWDLRAVW